MAYWCWLADMWRHMFGQRSPRLVCGTAHAGPDGHTAMLDRELNRCCAPVRGLSQQCRAFRGLAGVSRTVGAGWLQEWACMHVGSAKWGVVSRLLGMGQQWCDGGRFGGGWAQDMFGEGPKLLLAGHSWPGRKPKGDPENVIQTSSLVQDRESSSDPHVHLIHGLTSYQLWYSELPEEMQLKDFDVLMQNEASGTTLADAFSPQIGLAGTSGSCNSVDIQSAEIYGQCNSESSIGNDKVPVDHSMDTPRKKQSHHYAPEFYMNGSAVTDDNGNASSNLGSNLADISIFQIHGLDAYLLPIQLQQSMEDLEFRLLSHKKLRNEHYLDAVKHLRIALHSDPPLLSALHPLIQLLLLGDQVEEALKELEGSSHNPKLILPLRYCKLAGGAPHGGPPVVYTTGKPTTGGLPTGGAHHQLSLWCAPPARTGPACTRVRAQPGRTTWAGGVHHRPDSGWARRFLFSPGGVHHQSLGPTWVLPPVVCMAGGVYHRTVGPTWASPTGGVFC
ncbi:hypothetical protein Taro_007982 [Colocasia esculenta]|uniref:Uncharacterized protein n=1 Tax=Colocasia esculenta TaxID=4460 RepID=A0A843TWF1_COLES|nr:hypothetical protein [Colocasia esculenta]